jgi:hypothetical protein
MNPFRERTLLGSKNSQAIHDDFSLTTLIETAKSSRAEELCNKYSRPDRQSFRGAKMHEYAEKARLRKVGLPPIEQEQQVLRKIVPELLNPLSRIEMGVPIPCGIFSHPE